MNDLHHRLAVIVCLTCSAACLIVIMMILCGWGASGQRLAVVAGIASGVSIIGLVLADDAEMRRERGGR